MKLFNNTQKPLTLELFIGPGSWLRAEIANGSSVEVPDEMADSAIGSHGLSAEPAAAKKAATSPKSEEK